MRGKNRISSPNSRARTAVQNARFVRSMLTVMWGSPPGVGPAPCVPGSPDGGARPRDRRSSAGNDATQTPECARRGAATLVLPVGLLATAGSDRTSGLIPRSDGLIPRSDRALAAGRHLRPKPLDG